MAGGLDLDPSGSEDGDGLHDRLDADRRALLDLTLRNPLLNYRPRKRGVVVVGESPGDIFRLLVIEGKRLAFLPAPAAEGGTDENTFFPPLPPGEGRGEGPDPPGQAGAAGSSALEWGGPHPSPLPGGEGAGVSHPLPPGEGRGEGPDPPGRFEADDLSEPLSFSLPPADPTDLNLQTGIPADQLQGRLLAISGAARSSLEERGVNTLFLALGMLAWSDADTDKGGRRLRAPLILVPVELERSGARDRFRLRHSGEDLGENLSLAEKLRVEFGLTFPPWPEDDELDVTAYFAAVAGAVADRPGWGVDRGAIALGFFSFGKLLMYRDLDPETWPEGSRPGEHPVVRALLREGFREPAPEIGDEEHLDQDPAVAALRPVLDADGSQTLAIVDAIGGRNLVIQGPPGTGKSQTIANLISEAVGRGQSVLFVAEKLAALEVVKRRLDDVGLGVACLELHSHKANKKAILDELRRTLDLPRPRASSNEDDLRRLEEVRGRLNAHCEAVNEPIGSSALSPREAFGSLLTLKAEAVPPPPFEIPDLVTWSASDFQRRLDLVEGLQARLASLGIPRAHPFWGARRKVLAPTETDRPRVLAPAARRATIALRDASNRLAAALGLPEAVDRASAERLRLAAVRSGEAPPLRGLAVRDDAWTTHRSDLRELIAAGLALADLHRRFDQILTPESWDQDLVETRQTLNTLGRRWWRFVWFPYHRARSRVARLCRGTPPQGLEGQLGLIDVVLTAQGQREVVRSHEALASRLFGPHWRGERSDWEELARLDAWLSRLHAELAAAQLPAGMLDLLDQPPNRIREPLAREVERALTAHLDAVRALAEFLEFDPERVKSGNERTPEPIPTPSPLAGEGERFLRAEWADPRGRPGGSSLRGTSCSLCDLGRAGRRPAGSGRL